MEKIISNYWSRWKQRRQDRVERRNKLIFREGWCWAMYRYFVEDTTLDSLRSTIECASHFNELNHFDYGVDAAIDLIVRLTEK